MNSLETLVTEYTAALAPMRFVKQYIVIICIFVFGALICDAFSKNKTGAVRRALLAYPVGLSAFSVTAYAMLITGIPYKASTILAAIIIETLLVIFLGRSSFSDFVKRKQFKNMAAAMAAVLTVAAVATSGIAPVLITNDTMYFFRRYPDSIVYFGGLRDQFDFWMTDTGLGIVSVDTLPALFGFGESFGIREFFHINFIAYFAMCVSSRAGSYLKGKGIIIATTVITAFLVFSTPFVILGHWALANMYFMEMFFIAAYTAYDLYDGFFIPEALLLVAFSLFRIEGSIFVVWLTLCLCLYRDMARILAMFVILPVFLLFGGYCLKIFTQFYLLDDVYLFMTPQKAVLLVGLLCADLVYLLFIYKKLLEKLRSFLPVLYILALVAGNGILLIKDRDLFIGNLNAFYSNLFRQSGWGMLPYFIPAMTVLLIVEILLLRRQKKEALSASNKFNIVTVVGFLLIVFAASFGRGDVLMEDVTDSGNRVFLQIVPLVVITYGELFMALQNDYGK